MRHELPQPEPSDQAPRSAPLREWVQSFEQIRATERHDLLRITFAGSAAVAGMRLLAVSAGGVELIKPLVATSAAVPTVAFAVTAGLVESGASFALESNGGGAPSLAAATGCLPAIGEGRTRGGTAGRPECRTYR